MPDLILPGATVYLGDCVARMREMPDCSVQMCVTSPPYFGLRDYGTGEWQGGDLACDHVVGEMRRGLGLAASAANTRGGAKKVAETADIMAKAECPKCGAKRLDQQIGLEETPEAFIAKLVEVFREVRRLLATDGTLWLNLGDSYGKGKQLLGMPWRVALALQADGWVLRQEIIWHKPNPMPESVTDRCTKSHESLFLLAKSASYFFDHVAIKEHAVSSAPPGNKTHRGQEAYEDGNEHHRTKGGLSAFAERARAAASNFKRDGSKRVMAIPGQNAGTHRPDREDSTYDVTKRNRRSVWTIATRPYKGAHFAVFPPALVEPCILAGSRPGDVVLDPFNGSGTTGQVALQHGRRYVGCELNAEYIELTGARLAAAIAAQAAPAVRKPVKRVRAEVPDQASTQLSLLTP